MEPIQIAVVIPCFNSGAFLWDAIRSVECQVGHFEVAEVVVVNDRSNDPLTLDVLRDVAHSQRAIVIENQGPKGAAAARNTGYRASTAQWLCFLDSDDVLVEASFQRRVLALDEYADCAWIGGDFYLWKNDGTVEPKTFLSSRRAPSAALAKSFELGVPLRYANPVAQFIDVCLTQVGVSLIRRDMFEKTGGFREHLRQAEDYQLWIRLAAISDFVFVPHPLMLYRQHGANTTAEDIPPRLWTIRAFKELLGEPEMRTERPRLRRRIARFYAENARYFWSRRNVRGFLTSEFMRIATRAGP